MERPRNKNLLGWLTGVILFSAVLLLSQVAVAQEGEFVQPGNTGLQSIQQTSGLGSASIAEIVGNIIRVLLTLCGVIALGIVIYGGFKWMTSSGNEELVAKAKKTLVNGAVGLLIVLSAFAITEFILRNLVNATGTQTGLGEYVDNTEGGSGSFGLAGTGGGVTGFKVKSLSPQGTQKYANLEVTVVFTTAIDESSLKNNLLVSDEKEPVAGKFTVAGEVVRFTPDAACPAPDTNLKCFTAGKKYTITVKGGSGGIISNVTKKALSCSSTSCQATFTSGSGVDKTAPTIANTIPVNGAKVMVEAMIPVSAVADDDDQLALGEIAVDGKLIETITPQIVGGKLPALLLLKSKNFSTKDDTLKKEHTITWKARDAAGNIGTGKSTVYTAPASCFNNKKDSGELDVDCGGDCGACPNLACVTDKDCANGYSCDVAGTKKCIATPLITGVLPSDGAPGTFVTIQGQGFGTSAGEVTFLGDPKTAADDVAAELACNAGWSNTEVVVVVPTNAKSGAVRIKNTAGAIDLSDNNTGLILKEFQINETQRPGLCGIDPSSGLPGTLMTITGNDALGQANVDRKLILAGFAVDKPVWGANTVQAKLPEVDPGPAGVLVIVKAMTSNPLTFLVLDKNAATGGTGTGGSTSGKKSVIVNLKPDKGSVGTYVTILGTGFGTVPGKVYFAAVGKDGQPSSEQVAALFPAAGQCAKNFWNDTQVVVKVPDMPVGDYQLVLYPYGKSKGTNAAKFVVNADKLGPQVCALVPSSGPADGNLQVTFYGENFGTSPGGALFQKNTVALAPKKGNTWGPTAVSLLVPKDALTGEVRLISGAVTPAADACDKTPFACSNPVFFAVQDCRAKSATCAAGTNCCSDGSCRTDCAAATDLSLAAFAWCIATGQQCVGMTPPDLITACSAGNKLTVPSPSPSNQWPSTQTNKVCSNPLITVKFTEAIDPASVVINQGSNSTLVVEECAGAAEDVCAKMAPQQVVLNNLIVSDKLDGEYGGIMVAPKQLKTQTTYRVSLTNGLVGAKSGLPLQTKGQCGTNVARCFEFTTGDFTAPCAIEKIIISPSKFTAKQLGAVTDPLAPQELQKWVPLPFTKDQCAILDPDVYTWGWSPIKKGDTSFDFASAVNTAAAKTTVIAKSPTAANAPAEITATELASGKKGTGVLLIEPGPPTIFEACEAGGIRSPSPSVQWSGGNSVCVNALVNITVNQQLDLNSLISGATIKECQGTVLGKECAKTFEQSVAGAWSETFPTPSEFAYQFLPEKLTPKTYYLVEIKTTVKGVGVNGKNMVPSNKCAKGVASCFTFRTADTDKPCQTKAVEVKPGAWNAIDYGVQKYFDIKNDAWADKFFTAIALGDNQCYFIHPLLAWSWSVDKDHAGYVVVDPEGKQIDQLVNQPIGAYKETKPGETAKLLATMEGVTGTSEISIRFPAPQVKSFWPGQCLGSVVCANTALGAEFTTAMALNSFTNKVYLYECPVDPKNPDCLVAVDAMINKGQALSTAMVENSNTTKVDFRTAGQQSVLLKKDTVYRVVLLPEIRSSALKPLIGFNYPTDKPAAFSWKFATGKMECEIDKVKVIPAAPLAKAQGEKQLFVTEAYSVPDSCNPEGQRLVNNFQWSWVSSDAQVASAPAATTTYKQLFVMAGKGTVKDSTQSTDITATANGRVGLATWKLQCASPPVACPEGTYPGQDKCCHEAPHITATYPQNGDKNICRNTLIYADINDNLNTTSANKDSIKVGYQEATASNCQGVMVDDYCYGTIPFSIKVINGTKKDVGDTSRVALTLQALLPEKGSVRVWFRGNAADLKTPAVRSVKGVPIVDKTWDFKVGQNVCALDKVEVYPAEAYLSSLTDTQPLLAIALSNQGGLFVPLSAIPNIYDWSWNWFTQDATVAKLPEPAVTKDVVEVSSGKENGETDVTGLATVVVDTVFKPTTFGKKEAAAARVIAFLCEKPWPASPNTPWVDAVNNFSLWYCRDRATGEPLPSLELYTDNLSDVNTDAAADLTTWKAFHLYDAKSGGAIGVRIEKNLKHYSPLEWYYKKGFKGQPSSITVGGYAAIRFGNTVYVGFGNSYNEQTLTNILVLSLSDRSTPELQEVFEQLVENVRFVSNLTNIGLCYYGVEAQGKQCDYDAQCYQQSMTNVSITYCHKARSKFQRDTERVIHLSVLARSLEQYYGFNGKYPVLGEGTFVPGLVSSKWPAWSSFLNEIGVNNIQDPLAVYINCGRVCTSNWSQSCAVDADCSSGKCVEAQAPAAGGYETATCWNAKNKLYSCNLGSSVYHYQSFNNGSGYQLGAVFETPANKWQGPLPLLGSGVTTGVNPNMCTDAVVGATNICGDKVLAGAELCDPPGSKVTINISADKCVYRKASVTCDNQCRPESFKDKTQCVNLCGNGTVDIPEKCDEGKLNGAYNHCPVDCGISGVNIAGACGDGIKQTNEFCDIGVQKNKLYPLTDLGTKTTQYAFVCTGDPDPDKSYTYVANGQEFYDKVIYQALDNYVFSNSNNSSLTAFQTAACMGDLATQKSGFCEGYKYKLCQVASECGPGLKCIIRPDVGSKYAAQQTDSCNWDCKSFGPYCGDSTVDKEFGEECDGDVVDSASQCTKKCSSTCVWLRNPDKTIQCLPLAAATTASASSCGDGTVNASLGEECDAGVANGQKCAVPYGANSSCSYCTNKCKKAYISGGFCGDGVRNGPEMCDGVDISGICDLTKYDYEVLQTGATCKNDCTLTKLADVACVSCATNSGDLTKKGAPPYSLDMVVRDSTLGQMIPGPTLFNVNYQGVSEGSRVAVADTFTVMVFGGMVNGLQTFTQRIRAVLDTGTQCLGNKQKYVLQAKHYSATGAAGLMNIGGVFTYPESKELTFDSVASMAMNSIDIAPVGQAGDYRIVVEQNNLSLGQAVVSVDYLPAVQCVPPSDCLPSTEVSIFYGLTGECLKNVKPPSVLQKTFISKYKELAYISYQSGSAVRFAGCLDAAPYVEIGSAMQSCASGVDANGKCSQQDRQERQVVVLRTHQGVYYPGVYQLKIQSANGQAISKLGLRLSVFYYNNERYTKVAEYVGTEGSPLWYPLYISPRNNGTMFEPATALKAGKY